MKGLSDVLSASNLHLVKEAIKLRFRGVSQFTTPEAPIVCGQNMPDDGKLLEICSAEYGTQLQTPTPQYIPKKLVNRFCGYDCIPIRYDTRSGTVYAGALPGKRGYIPGVENLSPAEAEVPICYYVKLYMRHCGQPDFLYELPAIDKSDIIVEEVIALQAADITTTNAAEGAVVYYNARKKKVRSRRTIPREDADDFTKLLSVRAPAPIIEKDAQSYYLNVQLDMHRRGRMVANSIYYGHSTTIYVLSDDALTETLEGFNIAPNACKLIRERMLSRKKRLRLSIGKTMLSKNTTILSVLRELVALDCYKITSVESLVETLVEGAERINTRIEGEYLANAAPLLRQSPDIVYIIGITNYTAQAMIQAMNIGRVAFLTIHASSISDVLSHLMSITNISSDRLLLSMHSCRYQELVRDGEADTIRPVNGRVYLSGELKMCLYGKSAGEYKMILQKVESQWAWSTIAFSRD